MKGHVVLVTGAGGFIGSHLCERLVQEGASVRGLCRYTSRRDIGNLALLSPDIRASMDVLFGDLADGDFVRSALSGCDTVFHLGASISVPYSYTAPREVVETNVMGTLSVVSAARALGEPIRIVHMSSSEVYGTAQRSPMDESHPLDAQSPYAASKVGADKIAMSFHLAFGIPLVTARPFNTYGPRQSPRAVIATIVEQALAGDELHLGATAPTRDFVYVTDTVDALIRLARSDVVGETFNIATGTDVSIADVVAVVSDLLGRELRVVSKEERLRPDSSEVYRLIGDASKLRGLTGWEPRVTLRDGLSQVIEWASTQRRSRDVRSYEI